MPVKYLSGNHELMRGAVSDFRRHSGYSGATVAEFHRTSCARGIVNIILFREVTVSWQEKWEAYAALEMEKYRETPVKKLLEQVRNGSFGRYYTIWYALAEKATAEEAVFPLYEVLLSGEDYLYRYHAAAALLKLSGITGFKPVDLSGTHEEVRANLAELGDLLRRKGFPLN